MPQNYARNKEEGQKGRGGDYRLVVGGRATEMRRWGERYHNEGDSGEGDILGELGRFAGTA